LQLLFWLSSRRDLLLLAVAIAFVAVVARHSERSEESLYFVFVFVVVFVLAVAFVPAVASR
jgi:hypothetical protein